MLEKSCHIPLVLDVSTSVPYFLRISLYLTMIRKGRIPPEIYSMTDHCPEKAVAISPRNFD